MTFLGGRLAQALEWDLKTPKDFHSYADRIKVAYDQVNRVASDDPGWRDQHGAFVKFYSAVQDASWWTLNDSTFEELREWERRLADWQLRLKSKGLDVGPQVKPPERSGSAGETTRGLLEGAAGLAKAAAGALAVYAVVQVLKR